MAVIRIGLGLLGGVGLLMGRTGLGVNARRETVIGLVDIDAALYRCCVTCHLLPN